MPLSGGGGPVRLSTVLAQHSRRDDPTAGMQPASPSKLTSPLQRLGDLHKKIVTMQVRRERHTHTHTYLPG